jgi:deoxycytidylate deaminase
LKFEKLINIAIEEAKKSTHPQHKIGCVLFIKNNIISKGKNYPQKSVKHLLMKKYSPYPYSVHAEIDAIINAKTDLKKVNLLVVRISKSGKLLLAKPCKYCQAYIDYVGIRKIYYSINTYPYIKILEK